MQLLNRAILRVLSEFAGLRPRLSDEEGQTLAEYGMIMALIAVGVVVVAVIAFRDAIIGAFENATDCLQNLATCA
jgi:Flp pilus assembly pilin Flp